MRNRSTSTTIGASQFGVTVVNPPYSNSAAGSNPVYVDSESIMWDEVYGGNAFKPCTHLKYLVELSPFDVYNGSDGGNAPNPNTTYTNRIDIPGGQHRPSSLLADAESYIPVNGLTSDDIGNCVFRAYNEFVNGVQALQSAVSIAEIRETPGLFNLWQRRLSAPHNIVNGFLNYSFGWKPLYRDFVAIARELRSFPLTVRKRLKAIGDGEVVRHFRYRLDNTIDDLNVVHSQGQDQPYYWGLYYRASNTTFKSRVVVVTIRANVRPKLGPEGQEILNKLGALGLVPSLATLWSVTRLSFVIDWFYNIGAAIENLQGSLTHDISNVRVGVSDLRDRKITTVRETTAGQNTVVALEHQRFYKRQLTSVPLLPPLTFPRRYMPYVLLSAIGLTNTQTGRSFLSKGPKLNIDLNLDALRNRLKRGEISLRGTDTFEKLARAFRR
jgi:hypothetical protein